MVGHDDKSVKTIFSLRLIMQHCFHKQDSSAVMAEKRLSASGNGRNEKRTGEVHLAIVRRIPLDTGSAVTRDGSSVQSGKQGLKAKKNRRLTRP
jgi:hypothetical protein